MWYPRTHAMNMNEKCAYNINMVLSMIHFMSFMGFV